MAESTLDKLADAVLGMAELMGNVIEGQQTISRRLELMDRALRDGEYSELSVVNGVDCYPFRDQFEQLCSDVADLKREASDG